MRSNLMNQRGRSASIMAWLIYGAVCALLGMCLSSWASIQKIGDGLILGSGYIPTGDSDWYCTNSTIYTLYGGASSCHWSGERDLPNNYMIAYIISADDSTKFQYIRIKFRVSDDDLNYYLLSTTVSGSDLTIDLDRYANGSKVADIANPTITGGYNNTTFFTLILNGSSIKIYSGTGTGMTNRIDVTDANLASGSLIVENTTGSTGGSIDSYTTHSNRWWFNIFQSPIITINGMDATNQWAMVCKSDGTTKVVSAQQSGGVSTINLSSYFPPVGDGVDWRFLKIGTSDSCSSGVTESLELLGFMSGDTFTFRTGEYLSYGGRLSNVTSNSATVWVRGTSAVNYTIEAQVCNSGLWNISSNYGTLSSSVDYAAATTITGLSANTCYDYRIKLGGNVQTGADGNNYWSFITKRASDTSGQYKIAWYCCQTSGKMPFYAFDVMSAINPDIIIGTGDYYYESEPEWEPVADTQAEMRLKYQQSMIDTKYGNLMRSKNFIYMWDDHEIANDYGNNVWCIDNTMSCFDATSIYTAANSTYNEYVQPSNPDYFTGISGEKDYVYRIGDVDIFVWDLMSYRDAVNVNDSGYYYGQNTTEKITNGGMENCAASEPYNWTSPNTTYTGCSTASAHSGTNGVFVSEWSVSYYLYQSFSVTSGASYTFTAWMRRSDFNNDYPKINIGTTQGGSEISTVSNTTDIWTQYSHTWVAQSTGTVWVSLHAVGSQTGVGQGWFDDVSITELPPEVQPTCTGTTGTATLNCISTTFTTESPAISTTRGVIIFKGRMYSVSAVVDNDTLTLGENLSCTGSPCEDVDTRIWKTGKTMMGRSQLVRQMNALKDSTAKYRLIVSTKALMVGWNGDNWNGGCLDGTCAQTARTGYIFERDFVRDYLNDFIKDANKGLSIIACDSHSAAMITDNYGWKEIMPSSIAAPSQHPIANWGNGASRAVQGPRMFGYLEIDTTATPPTEQYKVIDENGRTQIGESLNNYKYNGGNVRNNVANHSIELSTKQVATTFYGGEITSTVKVRYAKSTSGFTTEDSIVSWDIGALGSVTALPAIASNTGQTSLWVVYPKCATSPLDSKVCIRNIGISGSTLSDNGETNIYDFGSGYTIGNLDVNINSDGYIFVGVEVIRNSDSFKTVTILKSPNIDSLSGTWTSNVLKGYINTLENGVSVVNIGNKRVGFSYFGSFAVYDGNTTKWRGTNGGYGGLLGTGALLGGSNITDNPFMSSGGNSDLYLTYINDSNAILYSKLNDVLFYDANLILWSTLHNSTTPQNEISPNAFSGTISGTPTTGTGKYGNGINFDGVDDVVQYADAAPLDITSSLFVSAWIDPTSDGVFDEIAGKWDSTANKSYRIYKDTDNKIKCRLSSDGTTNSVTLASLTSVLAADGLVWVACMFDDTANMVYVYINSASTADNSVSYTSGIFSGTAPFRIGNDVGGANWWAGIIDEVILFNRTLDATERQNIKDNMMTNFTVTAQAGTSPSVIVSSGKLYLSYIVKDSPKFRILQTSNLSPTIGTDFTEFTNYTYDTNLLLKRVSLIRGTSAGKLYLSTAKYGSIGSASRLIGDYGYNYSLLKIPLAISAAPQYYISKEGKWSEYLYH